jgi:hypothetical protein
MANTRRAAHAHNTLGDSRWKVKFYAQHDVFACISHCLKLDCDAIYLTFCIAAFRWILCFMQDETYDCASAPHGALEYRKGCPACEHSDPVLERELQAFAQLLFDIYLWDREKERQQNCSPEIDNIP